jgi:hypothetical protein
MGWEGKREIGLIGYSGLRYTRKKEQGRAVLAGKLSHGPAPDNGPPQGGAAVSRSVGLS